MDISLALGEENKANNGNIELYTYEDNELTAFAKELLLLWHCCK